MIKIIIADDHDIVVEGLSSLLASNKEISIIDKAKNGKEVISVLKNLIEDKIQIDVAVIDINMPEMDGIELTKFIKANHPNIKILVLTMHNEIGFVRRVIEAGADGYILKNKGKEELERAIYSVNKGSKYIGEEVTKILFSSIKSPDVHGEIKITKREKDVLKLIANGFTTPKISEELSIAPTTIETHRRNLIVKTGVKNSKGLVKFAVENGFH